VYSEKGNSFTVINPWGDDSGVEVSADNEVKVNTKHEGNKYTFGTIAGRTYKIIRVNH
jgi:hypothetical protein